MNANKLSSVGELVSQVTKKITVMPIAQTVNSIRKALCRVVVSFMSEVGVIVPCKMHVAPYGKNEEWKISNLFWLILPMKSLSVDSIVKYFFLRVRSLSRSFI